ncbi:F-box protein SKIP2-like [Chenopodium quinoa]|uniref:F-box protein SKIP2-like n=1 Tax=Chenopodium quinoa TaxID=63459 RepID=UPI000B76C77C|nr:F-box protein SKIP2-like [Chenopodium quinoa]
MGQSPSVPTNSPELTRHPSRSFSFTTRFTSSSRKKSTTPMSKTTTSHPPSPPHPPPPPPVTHVPVVKSEDGPNLGPGPGPIFPDPTSEIPDECLAHIFLSLSSGDRKRCSLVCKRWFLVEGQSRCRLSLNANKDISAHLPSLFSRFDSVTKLALRCDRRSISISDDALVLISLRCRNLTRLKLRGCRELTDLGIAAFAQNCKSLKKLSCGSCVFGAKGLNAVLEHCVLLEEISIKRLRGINNDGDSEAAAEPIGPGLAAKSLKSICLKELYNGQLFGPLIVGSKNLKTLKLIRCLGEWDRVLEMMATDKSNYNYNYSNNSSDNSNFNGLVEIHLERIQVTDFGLSALSNCASLEILHLVKTPECTNIGIISVAERCKLLRKVHIDGWRTNKIGDEGLIVLGKNCVNLQELVLIGINPTNTSLEVIASNCRNLERLALCSSETIGDAEMVCIATKCSALKKFCIKSCPISDNGLEALAWGCPNLVKIKVKKCRDVTRDVVEWLREKREALIVNLDADEIEAVDASASEAGGAQEDGADFPAVDTDVTSVQAPPRSNGRGSLFRTKLSFLFGRNIAACALRRWSTGSSNTNGNQ